MAPIYLFKGVTFNYHVTKIKSAVKGSEYNLISKIKIKYLEA